MIATNPKREFTIAVPIADVGKSILQVQSHYPKEYQLDKADDLFHQYRFIKPGALLDMGYYIDFVLTKVNETDSKIDVEVSRRAGAINTNIEMGIANETLKNVVDRLSLSIKGQLSEHVSTESTIADQTDKSLSRILWGIIIALVAFAAGWIMMNRR